MIKFFRNIRRRLLRENRFTRYLIYAIGEIILVVIGILIALQINNWNEESKIRDLEQTYLASLRNDLQSDKIYLKNQIEESKSVMESNRQFIKQLWQKQESLKDAMKLVNLINTRTQKIILQSSTYEELKSTGKLSYISNDSLRKNVIEFYRNASHSIGIMDTYDDYTMNLISDQDYNFFKLHSIWTEGLYSDKNLFHKSDWEYLNDPESRKFKQIENLTTQFIGKHREVINSCNDLLTDIEKIINHINEYLNSK
ncbi:hypothetical protein GCM10023115_44540 [Pontixanthobacter gangjinensis]|uniref:Uncharacterized protein n=1 Tax=Christiangramia aestuarii TaxID=1028746 RepID=A0A7M3SXX3_9FLAO|nr:DUF6090 family protein [Christiangramia aestuarii]MUP41454.1 hypothetical protein [Christiangramia aestuarii]